MSTSTIPNQNQKTQSEVVVTPFTGTIKKEQEYGYTVTAYCNGIKHGLQKAYYSDDVLKAVSLYTNGEKNGRAITYWPNGTKKMNANYCNGKMEGIYEEWSEKGVLVCRKTFYNGKVISIKGKSLSATL